MESTQAEQKREKGLRQYENRLRKLGDYIKDNNIHITKVPEEGGGKEEENLFEKIVAKNILIWGRKQIPSQIQKA